MTTLINKTQHTYIASIWRNLWRLSAELSAVALLYSLVAHVINHLARLFSRDATQPDTHATAAALAPIVGIRVPLHGYLAEILIACIVLGVITYIVLQWLCSQEWVQEPVQVDKCWKEVRWYNPFSWFVAIVCTVVEVLKWVFKQICGWKEVLVTVLVVSCIVTAIFV